MSWLPLLPSHYVYIVFLILVFIWTNLCLFSTSVYLHNNQDRNGYLPLLRGGIHKCTKKPVEDSVLSVFFNPQANKPVDYSLHVATRPPVFDAATDDQLSLFPCRRLHHPLLMFCIDVMFNITLQYYLAILLFIFMCNTTGHEYF